MSTTLTDVTALPLPYAEGQGRLRRGAGARVSRHRWPGAPRATDASFQRAIQALFAVSCAAHFIVKKESAEAPRVMPLEALWWVDGPDPAAVEYAGADAWHWRALMMQPAPIVDRVVDRAVAQARAKDVPDLAKLRYERWEEGRCAQTIYVGPYSAEGPTIAALHEAIAEAGCRLHGYHHEIYLGDPRRSAPEKLRTLLRQQVEGGREESRHG